MFAFLSAWCFFIRSLIVSYTVFYFLFCLTFVQPYVFILLEVSLFHIQFSFTVVFAILPLWCWWSSPQNTQTLLLTALISMEPATNSKIPNTMCTYINRIKHIKYHPTLVKTKWKERPFMFNVIWKITCLFQKMKT